jgi:hypothetical protein
MNESEICIGDEIARSPNGEGVVTGISREGFAEVNGLAVAWCARTDGRVYNPRGIGGQAGDLILGASSWKQPEHPEEVAAMVDKPVYTYDDTAVSTFDELEGALRTGVRGVSLKQDIEMPAPAAAATMGATLPPQAPAQAPTEPQAPAAAVAAPVVPPPAPAEPPAAPVAPPKTVAPVQHAGAETPQGEAPQDGTDNAPSNQQDDGGETF